MGLLFGVSLLLSYFNYNSVRAFGSWWCFMAVLVPIIKLLLPENYFRIK